MLSRQFVVAIGAVLLGCSVADAQTPSRISFSRVVTDPNLGRLEFVHAVTDLNGDGRDDILAGGYGDYYDGATPEERFTKTTLHVFVSVGDGSLRHAPELVDGTIDVRNAVVAADDFNGDAQPDLAVFDAGVYVASQRSGYGNPPQLFLSSEDGLLRPSDALADAVRREHELRPNPDYSGPADLHLKLAKSGDIDGDGDIDLWVESTGGANVTSHFMVNNGDGTFTLDPDRAPYELLHNPPPEYWRHVGADLVDLDNDGDLDLALGQIRDVDPTHINQFSIVLVNDGTGHYPERIELPHPAFADAYTSVQALTHFDVNGDGFQDLLLPHGRNDDGPPGVLPWTGRYIQILINDGTPSPVLRRRRAMSFVDETPTRMGDQSATTPERNANGDPLNNAAEPSMHDVDRDGCADLVMSRLGYPVRTESPLVYRNNGSGQFQAMSPEPFAGSDHYLGAALLRRGVFALFMGLFARGCVSPVLLSGGQQPSQRVPASFRRPAEPGNGTEHRRSVPLGRAPFWTFARRSGTVPWEGRQTCDGCDDRIPGTYIRRAANRRPLHRSPEPSPVRSGRCCLRGCQSLPLVQRSPADERERTRTGTAPAAPGFGTQAPARTSRPTQPERGCWSGRGHQRCRVLGAARARKPRRNDLRHDAGCGSGLRAARSRRLASARCRAEPAAGALLGPDAPPRDHRDRLAGTTAYALEATVVLDIIHVAAATRRAVLVVGSSKGLSAFGPRPDGSRPAHGDTWLQLRRFSAAAGSRSLDAY